MNPAHLFLCWPPSPSCRPYPPSFFLCSGNETRSDLCFASKLVLCYHHWRRAQRGSKRLESYQNFSVCWIPRKMGIDSFTQYLCISLPCDSWLLLNSRCSHSLIFFLFTFSQSPARHAAPARNGFPGRRRHGRSASSWPATGQCRASGKRTPEAAAGSNGAGTATDAGGIDSIRV